MPAAIRKPRPPKPQPHKRKSDPLPSRIAPPSRNGHTKQHSAFPHLPAGGLPTLPKHPLDGVTIPREMADHLTLLLAEKMKEMDPDTPVLKLLSEHGILPQQAKPTATPSPPSPLLGAFSVSTGLGQSLDLNGAPAEVPPRTPYPAPSQNGSAKHPQPSATSSATTPSTNGTATRSGPAKGPPSTPSTDPAKSPIPPLPKPRVDPELGPSVFANVSVSERLVEVAGLGKVLPYEAAQRYLDRVREGQENPQDLVEQMHLDLIAASHQLTLKFHANAAREDVSHEVAVAYAGAATQLLGGFTAMSKSLETHRESRRGKAAKSKRSAKSGTSN